MGPLHEAEGRPGQRWRVLQSPEFLDVIVRSTEDVSSRELRRHQPNEILVQRDVTVELPTGLVRMPIMPDGWVTVHARHIGGPTFMEEVSIALPVPITQAVTPGVATTCDGPQCMRNVSAAPRLH